MQIWSLRSYLCLTENYILRYIMKIYMVDHANLVITIISLFVRELFAQLFPASLLVSPEIEIKLKKKRILRYISIYRRKERKTRWIYLIFWYITIVMVILMRNYFSPCCSLGLLVPSQNQKGQKKNLKSLKMLISNKSNQHHPHLLWFQVDLPRTRQVFYRLLSPCQEQS